MRGTDRAAELLEQQAEYPSIRSKEQVARVDAEREIGNRAHRLGAQVILALAAVRRRGQAAGHERGRFLSTSLSKLDQRSAAQLPAPQRAQVDRQPTSI